MSLLRALRLLPPKKVSANPVAAGSLDMLAVMSVAAPLTIAQATETRQEQLQRESALVLAKQAADTIFRNTQIAAKRKATSRKSEELQSSLATRMVIGPLLLGALGAVGTVVSLGFGAIAAAAGFAFSLVSSAIGGILAFAMANPLVLIGAGIVGLGFLGYKFLFSPDEDAETGVSRGSSMLREDTAGEPAFEAPSQDTERATKPHKAEVSVGVANALKHAAVTVGVPLDMLTQLAGTESAFREDVRAPKGSATGLFQFLAGTWKDMVKKYGAKYGIDANASRTDPVASSVMAAAMLKHEGIPAAAEVVGTPTVTDVYITHFKGAAGGKAFLRQVQKRPNAIAADYVAKNVLANNRAVFYRKGDLSQPRTFKEVYDYFTQRLQRFESHVSAVESMQTVVARAPAPEHPPQAKPVQVADASSAVKPLSTASFIPSNVGLLRVNHG